MDGGGGGGRKEGIAGANFRGGGGILGGGPLIGPSSFSKKVKMWDPIRLKDPTSYNRA